MNNRLNRAMLALVLIAFMPTAGHAQFGGLKKKLKEKAGLEKADEKPAASSRSHTNWSRYDKVEISNATLDAFIAAMKAEYARDHMTAKQQEQAEADRQRRLEAAEKQRAIRSKCVNNLDEDIMALGIKMQERAQQLAQAGDPNPIEKATKEMQAAAIALPDKKCGKEQYVANDAYPNGKDREWFCAYVAARAEMDAAKANEAMSVTPAEAKILEVYLPQLRDVCDEVKNR